MKNNLLILGIIMFVAALPVSAELTTADTSSADFLINSGHSAVGAEMAQRAKAIANAVPFSTEQEQEFESRPDWQKRLLRTYMYLDPAADTDSFMNHDIKIFPSTNDL